MNLVIKNIFAKKYPTVFIDRQSQPALIGDGEINIILSPSFYWFKSEDLPVKSAFSAKKLLPSIFESVLPDGQYGYHAVKKEGRFDLFAFDDSDIVKTLEDIGFKTSQIKGIYFAQNEIPPSQTPYKISQNSAMIYANNGWLCVPLSCVNDAEPIENILPSIEPKEEIAVNFFKDFAIPEGSLYKLIAAFVFLIAVFGAQNFILNQELKKELLTKYKIMDDYALPKTAIELESLKGELLDFEQTQIKLRSAIKKTISLPLIEGEKFVELTAKKNSIIFSISLKEAKRAEDLKDAISKIGKISSLKVADLTLIAEVKI